MTVRRHVLLAVIPAALAIGAAAPAAAQQRQPNVRVGVLECRIGPGVGMIITSTKGLTCTLRGPRGTPRENYVGTIRKFGLDIGATAGGQIAWAVFAPTRRPGKGALQGTYVGAGADASIGAGLGANALVGGGRRSFALQPLSVQGQVGVNLAAGVTELELVATR